MKNKRLIAYTALLINTIIWGAALPIVKPALDIISPHQYLFFRYLTALPFTIPIFIYLFLKYKPSFFQFCTIVAMEFLAITVALSFLYAGLTRTSSIEAGLIANAAPVFITIGGVLLLKEHIDRHELVGTVVAVCGVTLITLEPIALGSLKFSSPSLMGNLLIIGYNFCWTAYIILAKKYYSTLPAPLIGFTSVLVGFFSFSFLTFISHPQPFSILIFELTNPVVFWPAIYMGILGSIIAVPAIIIGNNLIEASEASLFAYIQPLIYIPLGVFWLNEPLTSLTVFGILISLFGVIIAERRFQPTSFPWKLKSYTN